MQQNNKRLGFSLFWMGLAMIINYGISFVLTSYITETIGVEANGFVTLAKTVSNYAIIFTGALNVFASRYISVEYHKGNIEKAEQYYSSVFFADFILGVIILLLTIVPILFLDQILVIPADLSKEVKLLFVLDFLNFIIVSASTAFLSGAIVKNRMDITGKIQTVAYLSEGIFLFVVYKNCTPQISFVGLGLVLSAAIIFIMNGICVRKLTPELHIRRKAFSMQAVKTLVVNGIWFSVNSLGNLLNTGLDLVITDTMLTTLEMGQLSVVKVVATIFSALYSVLAQPFQPALVKAYAEDDKEAVIGTFKKGIQISGLVSNLAFAGFFALGEVYYKLWTPSQDAHFLHMVTIIAVFGGIMEGAVYPLYYTYTLTLKNKVPCFFTILSGLLNVGGMFLLIKFTDLGIYGVVLTTAVLSWGINFVFTPLYTSHCLGVKKTTFYPALLKHLLSCILMSGIFYGITKIYMPSNWLTLILVALLFVIIGSLVHIVITMGIKKRKKN